MEAIEKLRNGKNEKQQKLLNQIKEKLIAPKTK